MNAELMVASLVSGLVGVVIGAMVTAYQSSREEARRDREAARVVYVELVQNLAHLDAAVKNSVSMPLRATSGSSTRGRLSSSVNHLDFGLLTAAYLTLEAVSSRWPEGQRKPLPKAEVEVAKVARVPVQKALKAMAAYAWPKESDRERAVAAIVGELFSTEVGIQSATGEDKPFA
jgi:hypothetical protein